MELRKLRLLEIMEYYHLVLAEKIEELCHFGSNSYSEGNYTYFPDAINDFCWEYSALILKQLSTTFEYCVVETIN